MPDTSTVGGVRPYDIQESRVGIRSLGFLYGSTVVFTRFDVGGLVEFSSAGWS